MNKKSNYWKNQKIQNIKFSVPNETIFRLMSSINFTFKNKKILDIGMGDGANLLEFKKRGSKIYGIDIRKNLIDKVIKKNNLSKNNFFLCDLNKSFPKINQKFDLIFSKDTFIYVQKEFHKTLLDKIYDVMYKKSYFLFQYTQTELKKKKNDIFGYDLRVNYSKLKKYHDLKNPVTFYSNSHIKNLLKKSKFKVVKSIFDISTFSQFKLETVTVNRYFLLRK